MRQGTDQLELGLISLAIVGWFGVLYMLIPPAIFLLCAVVGVGVVATSVVPLLISGGRAIEIGSRITLGVLLLVVLAPVGYLVPRLDWEVLSVVSVILLTALTMVFLYYSLVIPMALLGLQCGDQAVDVTPPFPDVTVIIPAYNEEHCVGAAIDALKAANYPDGATEVVVVDDGSTDDTYQTALAHANETVRVLSKPNGGKHTALNYGLEHSTGELVVTIDADSLLERDGLKRIASVFRNDDAIGALAGDVRVANRGSLITDLQELEYLVGIQLFRRAFDLAGTVAVVPGAFGAFLRAALARVGGFEGDTLTEDRDATVKILKAGYETRAIDARCLTEAPSTWRDLYRQRLRWYRGAVQTVLKHRDVFRRPELGFLYSFAFPLEVITAIGVPVAGVVIVAAIAVELLFGSVLLVVSMFSFFAGLQVLVSVLALRVGDGDLRLVVLAPLFVLGYRQFLDAVMIKSIVDVVSGRDLEWTSPGRTGRLGELQSGEMQTARDQ